MSKDEPNIPNLDPDESLEKEPEKIKPSLEKDKSNISDLDPDESPAQDPKQAHLKAEIEQLKQHNKQIDKQIEEQFKKSKSFLKSPWLSLVIFPIIGFCSGFFAQLYFNNQEINQADRRLKKDIYEIFINQKDTIYGDDQECKSIIHLTFAVFKDEVKLNKILDRLTDSIPDIENNVEDCKALAMKLADKSGTDSSPSPQETEEKQEKITQVTNSDDKKSALIEIEKLVQQFTGDDRKPASLALIDLANNKGKKTPVVNSLISGIVNQSNTNTNEYRKNLYVAYTLSKIDNWGVDLTPTDINQFCKLKTSQYYTGDKADSTFTRRVDQAIASSGNNTIKGSCSSTDSKN